MLNGWKLEGPVVSPMAHPARSAATAASAVRSRNARRSIASHRSQLPSPKSPAIDPPLEMEGRRIPPGTVLVLLVHAVHVHRQLVPRSGQAEPVHAAGGAA